MSSKSEYTPPPIHPSPEQQPINITQNPAPETPLDESDLFMKGIMQRKDTEIRNNLATALKKLTIFPVFGDKDMAKISINYFLYLEFFHVAIRMFREIFIFSVITFAIYGLFKVFGSSQVILNAKLCLNLLNGVIAVFILKRAREKEETRIFNEEMLYNLQWSEDLFSVLVEGLPRDVTQDEINFFFKFVLAKDDQVCRLVNIMFLHNYREYVPLKKKLAEALKKQEEYQTKGGEPAQLAKVNQEIKILEEKISKYTQEITQMKHFKGKAIVLFERIETQAEVLRFFNSTWIKKILIFLIGRCFFKKHYLRGHWISVKQIAEPRDLLFENLHYSFFERLMRMIVTYSFSFLIIGAAIFIAFTYEDFKQALIKDLIDHKLLSYFVALFTMLVAILLEKAYLYTQGILKHISNIDAKIGLVNYCFYASFFVYCAVQVRTGFVDLDFAIQQLLRIAMFFTAKTIIFKLIGIYSATKAVKHASEHISNNFINSIATKAQNYYQEFNFAKGITAAFPPLLIGSAFFCAEPLFLLPTLMIILYVYAIIDKYRLIKGADLFISKSANFMLRPFDVYKYIPLISFFCNWALVSGTSFKLITPSNNWLYQLAGIVGLIGLVGSLWFPKPLHERVKEKLIEKNASATYESVCHEFSSVFRKEDPYHQTNLMNSGKNQKV